jgi:hypothetical protein
MLDPEPLPAQTASKSASPLSWPVADEINDMFPNAYEFTTPQDNLDTSASWTIADGYTSSSWPIDDGYLPDLLADGAEGSLLESSPSTQELTMFPEVPPNLLVYPLPQTEQVDSGADISLDLTLLNNSQNMDVQARSHRLHDLSQSSRVIMLLGRLNGTIARQLAEINVYPVRATSLRDQCYEDSKANSISLAPVLQTTSEFMAFLQTLRTSSFSSRKSAVSEQAASATRVAGSAPSSGSSGPISSIDIPTVLMLLAGHLQLIQLYDALFARAYVSLRETAFEDIIAMQNLPGAQLPGIPLVPGLLQIKIIFQVIEHYLQQIERFIGLPLEYCVFRQQDNYQGILSTFESPILLQAVMEQVSGARGSAGMCHISSLKDSVHKVHELLQSY